MGQIVICRPQSLSSIRETTPFRRGRFVCAAERNQETQCLCSESVCLALSDDTYKGGGDVRRIKSTRYVLSDDLV